jgi:hypothetical protein
MKITEISYSIEVTVNTGNFENVKPSFGAKAEVAEGESAKSAFDNLVEKIDYLMDQKLASIAEELAENG